MSRPKIHELIKRLPLPSACIDALLLPSDIAMIRRKYRRRFGCAPRLSRPTTFSEWQQYSKLFLRNRRRPRMVDKIRSRALIAELIGPEMVMWPLWTGRDVRAAPHDTLPERFFLKASHASGLNRLVVNDGATDWEDVQRACAQWLACDHSRLSAEWEYRWVEPRLLIEEVLSPSATGRLVEYQFWCFGGEVAFVEVDFDTKAVGWTRLFFDREMRPIDMRIRVPAFEGSFEPSPHFAKMRQAAETLARGEPFLRVDFFDADRPVIGELSLHPAGGFVAFEPDAWDTTLGELFRAVGGQPAAPALLRLAARHAKSPG